MGGALVGIVDKIQPTPGPGGAADRADGPQAQQGGRSRSRSTRRSTSGSRARSASSTSRSTRGTSSTDLAQRRDGAAVAVGLRGRPRPGPVDVRPADARRRGRSRRSASATRWPGAATTSTTRSGRSSRWSRHLGRWPATWRRRRPTSAASCAAWSRSRGALVPVAKDAGRPVHATSTRTFTALSTVAVPFLQDWISDDAAGVRERDRPTAPTAVVRQRHRRAVRRAASRVRDAPAERAGARRRVRHRDPQPPRHDRSSTSGCVSLSQHLRELRRRPRPSPRGLEPADADGQEPALAARVPDAGAVDVQLRDAVPAQHLEPLSEPICTGTALRFNARRDRRRARRARPSRRSGPTPSAGRPVDGQLIGPLHVDPVPEHRLSRPDAGMRGGQRALLGSVAR